jgi:CheY-like chemotaxis protein
MTDKQATVLVVDDNEMMRKLLGAELGRDPRFRVEVAATGAEGLDKAVSSGCSVIVLDMILPDMDGLQFIEQLRSRRPDCPSVIAITGAPQSAIPDAIIEAPFRGQVSAVFRKPFDHAKLRETIAFCAGV